MKESALSIANYFVQKSLAERVELKPLKLMKLVYIAHGFMLALLDKSILNPKFDKVEAWKYGPVIPSVYHSFKSFRDKPITEKTVIVKSDDGLNFSFEEPILQDQDAIIICNLVWKRYVNYSDSELVSILHGRGTPWGICYAQDKNNPIPDSITKAYYKGLIKRLLEVAKKNG